LPIHQQGCCDLAVILNSLTRHDTDVLQTSETDHIRL